MGWLRRGLLVLLALLLTACPKLPFTSPVTGGVAQGTSSAPPLEGRVMFPVVRQTQATMTEIGLAATVALIDATTGYTIGSTVTDASGSFILKLSPSFRPVPNTLYYLEATKGLSAGTPYPNRVGADLARVRTIAVLRDGWYSISGQQILVNGTSTALSIITSLRSMTPLAANRRIDPLTMISIMQPVGGTGSAPSPYLYPDTNLLPSAMVTSAYLLVNQALAQDADPFANISLDTADSLYNTLLNAPKIVSVASLNPATQQVGGTMDIIGSGFSATASDNVVEFTNVSGGPVAATVTAVSADRARLSVTVPNGAVTGPVAVTIGGRKMIGPTFYLALQSGHEAIDTSGNLYVANETFGTIARISPQGQISTFVQGLTAPRALTLRNGKLYVTCAGTKKGVVTIDPTFPGNPAVDYGTAGTIQDPRGIAFDGSGRCFVSDGANNKVYRIDATASTPVALTVTGTALGSPRGIAFGADGRLYVANNSTNNVTGLTLDTGTGAVSAVFQQGFSAPWGVAFDSLGNMYVSNNLGNSVYRWRQDNQTLSPYADMPSPGGLVADRSGYVYAIDNTSNNVYRITSQGDSSIFASGLSSPTGISKVGNVLYVLSQTNNSLVAIDTTTTSLQTVARGFNQPMGLAYDSTRDCFYVSNTGNATICRVNRTTGITATVLTGLAGSGSGPGGIMYQNGRLYVPNGSSVLAYDVTNFGATPLSYRSNIYNMRGLSKDTVSAAASGSFYIATGTNNRILRVNGDAANTGYTSANGSNYAVVFKDAAADANLNNPTDLTVDGSGNVWVANYNGNSVTSYRSDGTTYLAPISSGTQPYGINFDGTNVWVVNYGSQNIKGYKAVDGSLVATLTCGTDHPRNLCFNGTTMYVVCDEGVGTIANFATTPGAYTRVTANGAGASDIEVGSDGSIYVAKNQGYKISPNYASMVQWYTNYDNTLNIWKVPGADDFFVTDYNRFNRVSLGNYDWHMAGSANTAHGWKLAGVDSNGNVYIQGWTQCGADTVTRIQTTSPQKEWWYSHWDSDCFYNSQGAFAADTAGNFFIGVYQGMGITKVDATGTSTSVVNNGSSSQTSYGLWADPTGATLYQTCTSGHRVDQITVSSGARTTLPFGLSAAEM